MNLATDPPPDPQDSAGPSESLPLWKKVWRSFFFRFAVLAAAYIAFPLVGNALRWPLRIIGAVMLVFTILAFVRLAREVADWLTDSWPRWRGKFQPRVEKAAPTFSIIEAVCALAMVVISTGYLVRMYDAMSWSSLREDEIGTIYGYSARGVQYTGTQYKLAKNHIFFNIVNALTPGRDSYHPLRARMWSFIAMGAMFAAIIYWAVTRRRFLEGGIIYALLAMNDRLLALCLEARGYGFITLATLLGGLALLEYLKEPRDRWLWIIGICAVLGTYTLPYFVLFGGLLLFLLYLYQPRRKVLLAGIFSLAALVLLFTPLFTQVLEVATDYDEDYDKKFEGFGGLFQWLQYAVSMHIYVFDARAVVAAGTAFLALPLLTRRQKTAEGVTGFMLLVLLGAFLAYFLGMPTAPSRITGHMSPAFAMVVALTVGHFFRHRPLMALQPLVAILLAGLTVAVGLRLQRDFAFVPRQGWLEMGENLRGVAPEGAKLWSDGRYQKQIEVYTEPALQHIEEPVVLSKPPEDAVAARELIVADPYFQHRHQKRRLTWTDLPPGARYFTVPVSPNYHRAWFMPPPAEERLLQVFAGERELPVSAQLPQPYDPWVLAESFPGQDFLHEPTSESNQVPADAPYMIDATAAFDDESLPTLQLPITLQVRWAASEAGRRKSHVNLLFSQALWDKEVTITTSDGQVITIPQRERMGELLSIPLPADAATKASGELEISLRPVPESRLQRASVFQRKLKEERPPLVLLEAWARTAGSGDTNTSSQ